jgi:hypothetical protein
MSTLAENLISLADSKSKLVDNLVAKGVAASNAEALTLLVGKVLEITGGGVTEYTPPSDWIDIETNIVDGGINLLINDIGLARLAMKCAVGSPNILSYNAATMEENIDQWSASSTDSLATPILSQDFASPWEGLACLKAIIPANPLAGEGLQDGAIFQMSLPPILSNTNLSFYAKGSGVIQACFGEQNSYSSEQFVLTDIWTRYSMGYWDQESISPMFWVIRGYGWTGETTVFIDGMQVELVFASPFQAPNSTDIYYRVDWGDGAETVALSNTRAEHEYAIGSGTPCSRGYTTFKVMITPVGIEGLTKLVLLPYSSVETVHDLGLLAVVVNSDQLSSIYMGGGN